jgi:hypothetical protein
MRADDHVIAVTVDIDSIDGRLRRRPPKLVSDPRRGHPASGLIARRRFDLDKLLNSPDDSILAFGEKFEKFAHAVILK